MVKKEKNETAKRSSRMAAVVEKVKKIMGVSTNKDVGELAFDYYYNRECDEDE